MNSNSDGKQNDLAWEEISTEHIVQDQWIDFRRSAYRFPDGREYGPRSGSYYGVAYGAERIKDDVVY